VNDTDGTGNVRQDRFESVCTVIRDGKEVRVREDMLKEEEARALRCEDLIQGFMVEPLYEEKERIEREIEHRHTRRRRLETFTGAKKFVDKVREKVWKIARGEMRYDELTDKEARDLEKVYARTMTFATLSPEEEGSLRDTIRKVAERDFASGTFNTMKDALRHYGLGAEVENGDTKKG
jgi:hypothetical protein